MATATTCSDGPADKAPAQSPPPQTVPAPVTPRAMAAPSPAPVVRTAVLNGPIKPPFTRTTLSGVYTADEASEGRDLYMGFCAGCHAAVSHTGPEFRRKWAGQPLSELFGFMRINMPKNDPGSLDEYQYQVLLAYILQMNKMPAGTTPLSPDYDVLAKIRIDTVRTAKR